MEGASISNIDKGSIIAVAGAVVSSVADDTVVESSRPTCIDEDSIPVAPGRGGSATVAVGVAAIRVVIERGEDDLRTGCGVRYQRA